MIFWCIFKILNWVYGWGEITDNTRQMMTALSGFEMMIVSVILIVFCFAYLIDIIESLRKK